MAAGMILKKLAEYGVKTKTGKALLDKAANAFRASTKPKNLTGKTKNLSGKKGNLGNILAGTGLSIAAFLEYGNQTKKKKPAVKRSMRFNKDVKTTTEKKATGKQAAFNKRMKAGQRKSNTYRKTK